MTNAYSLEDDFDAALQPRVEVTLASTTGQNLRLDDDVFGSCRLTWTETVHNESIAGDMMKSKQAFTRTIWRATLCKTADGNELITSTAHTLICPCRNGGITAWNPFMLLNTRDPDKTLCPAQETFFF